MIRRILSGIILICWITLILWIDLSGSIPVHRLSKPGKLNSINISMGSTWKYFKGTREASPRISFWRKQYFDDSSWPSGDAPFRYGTGSGGTVLSDMRGNYSTLFMRKEFTVTDPSTIDQLKLTVNYNDGFVIWINGVYVKSKNKPRKISYNSLARGHHKSGSLDRFTILSPQTFLRSGTNIIAAQGFNSDLSSSSFYFDMELTDCDKTEDVKFSVKRGFYDSPFDLTLKVDIEDAVIRYTVDGSKPSGTHGTVYTSPINISRTTCVRAKAYKRDIALSDISTHTYIFPSHVIQQKNQAPGGKGVFWDTEMDTEVTSNPRYKNKIIGALNSIPTISVVMPDDDLFGPHGIHRGPNLEKKIEKECSVELIYSPDVFKEFKGFQANCGIKIQGGAGCWNQGENNHKQSFCLMFKKMYGSGKLRYPVFESFPIEETRSCERIDRFILRSSSDTSFASNEPRSQREKVVLIRDQWGRYTQLAMSGIASHGTYVHLYLNGLYWGVYNLVERPDHRFSALYMGGMEENWFAGKIGRGFVRGDRSRYDLLRKSIVTRNDYLLIKEYVDTSMYIDWCLLIWYSGLTDIQGYVGNFNDPLGPVLYYAWDLNYSWDIGLDSAAGARIKGGGSEGRKYFHGYDGVKEEEGFLENLLGKRDFKMELADRVYKHCFNNGALTDANSQAKWMTTANFVEEAMIAELARWGDEREPKNPIDRDTHWIKARDRVMAMMNGNVERFINLLRLKNLYPDIDPPVFNMHGGKITPGYKLTMSKQNVSGTIYYTLDGKDPRALGGNVSPQAKTYHAQITIDTTTTVKARLKDEDTWSALSEATFFAPQDFSKLKITEIMYNPEGGDAYEFIEMKNTGTTALNLSKARFSEGILYRFPDGSIIGPKEFIVLVAGPLEFKKRYPAAEIFGRYMRSLSNKCSEVTLVDHEGAVITSVTYTDKNPWPAQADGDGYSLVTREADPEGTQNDPKKWCSSREIYGSPGKNDESSN